jgi:sulfatase modifying factor 1
VKTIGRPLRVGTVVLVALECCTLLLGTVWISWTAPAGGEVPEPPSGMQSIPGGAYAPLFKAEGVEQPTAVAPFYLDMYAVTNAQYVAFVQANPRWRRSQVSPLLADMAYLRHWQADLPRPEVAAAAAQRPVTSVSWFAARAYCRWQQKRLPSSAEWEYVALASETAPDGRQDPGYQTRLLEWYTLPAPAVPPLIGSGQKNYWGIYDLHGSVWEWVADFQTAFVSDATRGDQESARDRFCGAGALAVLEQERVNYPAFMRYAYRSSLRGTYTVPNLGFRCAKDLPRSGAGGATRFLCWHGACYSVCGQRLWPPAITPAMRATQRFPLRHTAPDPSISWSPCGRRRLNNRCT